MDSVPSEDPLPGLQMGHLLATSTHAMSSVCLEGQSGGEGGTRLLSDISFYKDTDSLKSGPHPYDLI